MTKTIPSAVLLGLLAGACGRESPQQAAPAAGAGSAGQSPGPQTSVPSRVIAVFVTVEAQGASPTALAQDWLKELQAAFAARPQQFKWVETRNEAEATVRIESAIPTPDSPDHAVMSGSLLIGETATPFRLDYTGGPAVMAGRFATYLVNQVEAARAAAAPKSPPPKSPIS